jgi:predicted histone-like DNA-binding protein
MARSTYKATVADVCHRVSERSSYSRGELKGVIDEFLIEVINLLTNGAIVQLGDLGSFRMSVRTATPTATAAEFNSYCIDRGKVIFRPGAELRKLTHNLNFVHYKPTENENSSSGNKGGGSEIPEAPEPMV